jgi:hypothetical protein
MSALLRWWEQISDERSGVRRADAALSLTRLDETKNVIEVS